MEKQITLTMNGVQVSAGAGKTILEVARENGVNIPTLCYLKDLSPQGACRLCVVEVEGSRMLVGSCHTPVGQGMVIQTHSPKVIEMRRRLVELMLASHPDSCVICDKANICELRNIATDLDIGMPRFRARHRYFPIEDESPCMLRDMSKCILCRRCVVGCRDIKGEQMFSVAYRGFESKVIYGQDQPVTGEACSDCDTCVSLCPTGALAKPLLHRRERRGPALFIKG